MVQMSVATFKLSAAAALHTFILMMRRAQQKTKSLNGTKNICGTPHQHFTRPSGSFSTHAKIVFSHKNFSFFSHARAHGFFAKKTFLK